MTIKMKEITLLIVQRNLKRTLIEGKKKKLKEGGSLTPRKIDEK